MDGDDPRRTPDALGERDADRTRRTPDTLDEIDADEWNAQHDAIERARAQRRAQRAQRRAARPAPPGDGIGARRAQRRAARPDPAGGAPRLLATSSGRLLAGAAGALALLTVIGLVALWPGGLRGGEQQAFGGRTLGAKVTATQSVRCPGPTAQRCRQLVVKLSDGPDKGQRATVDLGPANVTPSLAPGDRVRVQRSEAGAPSRYAFADVDRRMPMLWLAIALGILALLVARWRGLLALLGVVLSVVLVVAFLVPAILAGSDPVLVSLVAALAVSSSPSCSPTAWARRAWPPRWGSGSACCWPRSWATGSSAPPTSTGAPASCPSRRWASRCRGSSSPGWSSAPSAC